MIELVLVYCLSDLPDRCLEKREALEAPVSMIACTMRAQNSAQEYLHTHPLYKLAAWRCEQDKPREEHA